MEEGITGIAILGKPSSDFPLEQKSAVLKLLFSFFYFCFSGGRGRYLRSFMLDVAAATAEGLDVDLDL